MGRLHRCMSVLLGLWVASFGLSCVTTPLPVPPTVDIERIEILGGGGANIVGHEGAISPPGLEIRLTYGGDPIDVALPEVDQLITSEEGAFETTLMGGRSQIYYIEAVLEQGDLFLLAITGDDSDSIDVMVADPGPDSDNDGSPDRIDCAPLDDQFSGQRCE